MEMRNSETVGYIIGLYDLFSPESKLTTEEKLRALSLADQRFAKAIGLHMPPTSYTDMEQKVLIRFPYDDYYLKYLAKITANSALEQGACENALQEEERAIRAVLSRKMQYAYNQ